MILSEESITPCLTQSLSPEIREIWKERYRYAKKYGIRAAFGAVTGVGWFTIMREAATDGVKCHAKRYMGAILLNTGLTFISGAVPLLSNSTRVIKLAKASHSVCAAAWRGAHNVAELPLIFCDYAIFGEYVPSCGEADYDFLNTDATDFINEFTK